MKVSKELKTGIIALLAIGLLIAGISFLKGNSFFGGDKEYYVYLPSSGGVTAATSVYADGVIVGKVLDVQWLNNEDSTKRVLMKFSIQEKGFQIPHGSIVQSTSIDFLTKGLVIVPNFKATSFHKPGDYLLGTVHADLITEVKQYADPLIQKVQTAVVSLDNFINQVSSFWDTTANSELTGTLKEVQVAIHKFGNAAGQLEGLVSTERAKLSKIFSNIENITYNLQQSNAQISGILGNAKTFTDDLVTADFKGTIEQAKNTLAKINAMLESASKGEGTLGKLLNDEQLYNELNTTNQRLQNLVEDFQLHPERYIHFSVFGAKTKGANFTPAEERKLKQLLDSTQTK